MLTWNDLLEKLAQKSRGEFAPGIPAAKAKAPIPDVPRYGKPVTWWYVDHKHEAVKSGLHSDLRLSDGKRAYSWAVRKGIPRRPGEKVLAVRQPDHDPGYIWFQGQLPTGYGRTKGRGVWIEDHGPARILQADQNKIQFALLHHQNPQRFTMVKRRGDDWLLINTTPTPGTRPGVPQSKPNYREAKPEEFEKFLSNGAKNAVTSKIDGAHCLPYTSQVDTLEHGLLPIGLIVNQRMAVRVKCYDGKEVTYRPVVNWFRRPVSEGLVRVFYSGGHRNTFRLTVNHRVMTPTGKVEAGKLGLGDEILVSSPTPGPVQTQALLGMLLGDSSIGYGNLDSKLPRISTTHGIHQEEYCRAKYHMLEDLCASPPRICAVNGHVRAGRRIRFSTRSLHGLESLAATTLVAGVKRVTRSWLDKLDEISLAFWFMDDGSTSVADNGNRERCQLSVSLHTEGYSAAETDLTIAYLADRWGVHARKAQDGRGRTYITMGNEASLRFLTLVAPFVHPLFEYKMGFSFRDYPESIRASFGARWREWFSARSVEGVAPARVTWVEPWTWPDSDGTVGYVYNIEVEETHNYFVGKALVANCSINFDRSTPEVYSYRPRERNTGLLDHTFLSGLEKVKTPDPLKGIRIRGELYAVNKDGKAIPARELGGIMNSSPQKGRNTMEGRDYKIRFGVFDVVTGPKGKPMESAPWGEKLKVLKQVVSKMKPYGFHLPEIALTPEKQKALFERIRDKKDPLTDEGVVVWPLEQSGPPTKIKFRPHHQVYIHEIVEGSGKYKGTMGSYTYSVTPGGPPVGFVGTGFTDDQRNWMWKHKDELRGRKVVILSSEQFPSGAYRAPSHSHLHD